MRRRSLELIDPLNLLALFAEQRADALSFAANKIKRIQARDFDIELCFCVLVEEVQSLSGSLIPCAVKITWIAAHAPEVCLQQTSNVGLVHLRHGSGYRR